MLAAGLGPPPALPAAAAAAACPPGPRRRSAIHAQPTPLLDAVVERGERFQEVPFHVPGHKRGGGTPPCLGRMLAGAERYDLTELEGGHST